MAELRKEGNKEDCIGSHLGPRLHWLPATTAMDNQSFLQKVLEARDSFSRASESLMFNLMAKRQKAKGEDEHG